MKELHENLYWLNQHLQRPIDSYLNVICDSTESPNSSLIVHPIYAQSAFLLICCMWKSLLSQASLAIILLKKASHFPASFHLLLRWIPASGYKTQQAQLLHIQAPLAGSKHLSASQLTALQSVRFTNVSAGGWICKGSLFPSALPQ